MYDQGRLTFADTVTGTYQYDYDKVGNRTAKTYTSKANNTTTENYTYAEKGAGNKLTSISGEKDKQDNRSTNYQYNKNGSPKQTKDLSYEYNANQRPIKVFKQTETNNKELIAEYKYNTFGERIKKTAYSNNQKTVTYYFYDGHTLTAEANEQGDITNQYVYLNTQPIAKLEKKTIYAIHSDHLGTPRLATNGDKQTVWKANYSPFGKATLETNNITLNLRFAGQYEDQETGTHYNYLRDYDPETGRYVTSDPIGLKGGVNTYAYVGGDPLRHIDPLGLQIANPYPEDNSTVRDRMGDFIDVLGGESLVKSILGNETVDVMNHLNEAISKEITRRYGFKGLEVPAYLKPEALSTTLLGVAAIVSLSKFADKINKLPVKNPVTGFLSALIKSLTKLTLLDALVDGIEGGKDLLNTLINQFGSLSALDKDADGNVIWDGSDLLGKRNCQKIDYAAASIVTGIMGVVDAGLGKKFFGKGKKNDPKDSIDKAYKKWKKKFTNKGKNFFDWWYNVAAGTGQGKFSIAKMRNYAKNHGWKKNGIIIYPPYYGFTNNKKTLTTIKKGTVITRYIKKQYDPEKDDGGFSSIGNVPFNKRALPGKEIDYQVIRYIVKEDISAYSGRAMAWFGHTGGSTQYQFSNNKRIQDFIGTKLERIE